MGRFLKIIPFIIILFIATNGYAQPQSPLEIVELFHKCYANPCMDEVADYTTAHFRDNKPKSVWVVDTWKALHKMNYKRLKSSILDSKVKGDRAAVIVNAKISTVGGDTSQKEIFYLIRKRERWLIDELVVTDEEIDLDKVQL